MKTLDNISTQAHWFLRLAIASVFIYHGLGKFPNLGAMSAMMGLPLFMLLLVALAETLGGVLVVVGGFSKDWMTRVGTLMLSPVILGAIVMVHWGQWHFKATETHPMGGMQFQVTLLLILLYLLVRGNSVKFSKATI